MCKVHRIPSGTILNDAFTNANGDTKPYCSTVPPAHIMLLMHICVCEMPIAVFAFHGLSTSVLPKCWLAITTTRPVVSPLKNVSPTEKKKKQKCCFFGPLHCNLCSSGDYIALRVISVIHSSLSLEVIDGLNYSMPHDKLVKVLEMLPTGKELDGVNFY